MIYADKFDVVEDISGFDLILRGAIFANDRPAHDFAVKLFCKTDISNTIKSLRFLASKLEDIEKEYEQKG